MEPEQLDTARLLVSELVANAVVHGEGTIMLHMWLRPHALRVEVLDRGGAFAPEDRRPEASATGGWGLQLVSTQSSRWGVGDDRARVWFELDLDGAPPAPPERPPSTPATLITRPPHSPPPERGWR